MKGLLNHLIRLVVASYTRFRREKIQKIDPPWHPATAPRSILVFSNTALGDTLLSTPAIVSLRNSFPDARITFFVGKAFAPLFAGFEAVDNMVLYHGGYKRFLRTVMELRREKPEIALLLHSNAPQDIPLAVLSGARVILKTPTKSEYRKYLSCEFPSRTQHTIEERLDLVRAIGATSLTRRMSLPRRYDPATRIAPSGAGRFKGATTIGFQVGAANLFKLWPAEYFSALADRLTENVADVLIVITGSPGEQTLGEEIIRGCRSANIRNACGAFRIEELPDLIRDFDLLVSNDTGTMHLAIALGTPTLCLFGATSSGLIGPFQDIDKHRVIQKTHECSAHIPKKKRSNAAMKQITVDEVYAAVLAMLAQRAETGGTKA